MYGLISRSFKQSVSHVVKYKVAAVFEVRGILLRYPSDIAGYTQAPS